MLFNFILSVIASFLVTALLSKKFIPALISRKMGQPILEIGPRWHKSKEGTPTMGGLFFIAAILILSAVFSFFAFPREELPKIWITLGMAALNTLVLATPLLNRSAAYTLPESIGSGIGAGLAFILAATLICKGLHIISQNQDMPKAFRGTPAAFIYIALLSLAFSGFSGSSLFS